MYECGKHFCHSTYECACTEKAISISRMGDILKNYKYEYKDMLERIVFDHKASERCAAYLEQSTEYFEDAANITANINLNSVSLLPQ